MKLFRSRIGRFKISGVGEGVVRKIITVEILIETYRGTLIISPLGGGAELKDPNLLGESPDHWLPLTILNGTALINDSTVPVISFTVACLSLLF